MFIKRRLSEIFSYEDARGAARKTLPRSLFQYVDGIAEAGVTAEWNLRAFRELGLRPRMGDWIEAPRLQTTVLGRTLALPVLTAPCGGMRVLHPGGDLAVAAAAAKAGTVHVASSASGYSLEEIAATPGPKWFQLYRLAGRDHMERLVTRAADAGYEALVVTIDTAMNGYREGDARNGFSLARTLGVRTALSMLPQLLGRPGWTWRFIASGMPLGLANTAMSPGDGPPTPLTAIARTESLSPTWEDIAWVRRNWKGPLVIKGLLTAHDARRAVNAGADGIIVSNHGGRQLDGSPASLVALAKIADAVGDTIDILLDSGIRRGSDIVKARALGAKAVLIGRMAAWGLATAGTDGVSHMLNLLHRDLIRTMRLLGCPAFDDLDREWIDADADGGQGGLWKDFHVA